MSIYDVFVINRAGSLIYDYSTKTEIPKIEKTFSFPLDLVLEVIDQKAVVVFGARDRIQLRYSVSAVNSRPVRQCRFTVVTEDGSETEHNVMEFLGNAANFPVDLSFSPPTVTQNEKIILSSTFHSLFAIAAQLSPMPKSSGIEVLETNQFRLHCFQSVTGVKFVVVASLNANQNLDALLRKIYELYADFALKNPFYSIDMPIRCERFDDAMVALLSKADSTAPLLTRMADFLSKIPNQLGYMVISNGAVTKSSGDLANKESIVPHILRMIQLGGVSAASLPEPQCNLINVTFADYFLSISYSGQAIYVVKRKR
ncbi:hypothetical protein QR680_017126 [Steinernema hermaphroditum]|uniref:Trafficking protein particle complex subunit 4 n=1 Tax=Steinernema hermaphroditum TaxID=289476 RepID=A0AA39HEL3_9BILA|nr:hypothetical protein QR680_017126 [Steinernema hermaphroditum]